MKLIIDIDDNLYTRLFDNGDIDAVDMLKACVSIRKGTPLDKIRSEIEEHVKINQNLNTDRARALCWCLDVIDKHKTESEEV